MAKQHSFKQRLVHLLAVTVLTTSVIGGTSLAVTSSVNAAQTPEIKVSQKQAVQKYNRQFKNTKINEISLEKEGQQYQYEIDGFDKNQEYTATIDAQTGKVITTKSDKWDADDHPVALKLDKDINWRQANKLAEKAAKDGHGQQWTLENDQGTDTWEVEVANGNQSTEVKINAQTKKVISTDAND